jgi:hypothetical protein
VSGTAAAAPRRAIRSRRASPSRSRDDRPVRQPQPQGRRGVVNPRPERNSSEPWSEVPPELEELLRAQLSTKLAKPSGGESAPRGADSSASGEATAEKAKPAARSRRKPAEASGDASAESSASSEAPAEKAKPAARSRRKPAVASGDVNAEASSEAPAAPKKRAPARKKTTAAAEAAGEALFGGGEPSGGESTGE